jgi:hypothetical protein
MGPLYLQDLKCRTLRTKEFKNVGLLQLQDLKCRSFKLTGIERGNAACIFPFLLIWNKLIQLLQFPLQKS